GLSATAGIHPHEAREWSDAARDHVRALLAAPEMVAVGETGLDYHYMHAPREIQRSAFAAQLALAAELGKPVIVHARQADADIAQAATLRPIHDVAAELGLSDDELELYGKYKAKIAIRALERRATKGRLVVVTGINPTPAGEGKSTVTVGVTQALRRLGKNAILAIREPSLGPVFGVKGGAAGGGY